MRVDFLMYSFVLVLLPRKTFSEVFTALVHLEDLLRTEAELMQTLEGYIAVTEKKLGRLKRHLDEFHNQHSQASKGVQEYLANPINAYLLTKRLTSNWKEVENLMMDNVGHDFVDNITTYRAENLLKFPTDEDLSGAAIALVRLQDTYKLDTSSVARGELNGVQYSSQLSANDCFELGRQTYQNKDYHHTILWMTEALERYGEELNKTVTKEDILEHLAFSFYMEGDIRRANEYNNKLLEIQPNHERAKGNKVFYENWLERDPHLRKKGDDGNIVLDKKVEYRGKIMYEKLCRKEIELEESIRSKLKCRYVDFGRPFLKLARVKEEEAFLNPRIVLYHDVLYDDEIKTIQQLATPRFRRATVQNPSTGEFEIANYRISKSAWLEDSDHPHVARVSRRVEDITGLDMISSESLQVVNYGIGGHYEPHFDFAKMTDVSQGGATVFPSLKVALWPKKGTAALWYNLRKNGEGDFLTKHAACPVLTGSKWICNKWIHERGQEDRRPCGLSEDEI